MNVRKYIFAIVLTLVALYACNNDDDDNNSAPAPLADRGEQAIEDDAALVSYLKTHFYNYESFDNPPADFDFKIVIDTIDADNSDKTALFDQVVTKTINFGDVDQKLYVLTEQEGVGQKATVADSTFVLYKGELLDGSIFDSAVTPIFFDLPGVLQSGQFTGTVEGFRQGLAGFGGASSVSVSETDGSIEFSNDHGIGAVFMPSGLAYFGAGRGLIGPYEPLVFTFEVVQINETDHDNDFFSSISEDLNNNNNLYDDDTDGDGVPNYLEVDDDGDGTLTRNEVTATDSNDDGVITLDEITFYDDDGDGIKNHLDPDDKETKSE